MAPGGRSNGPHTGSLQPNTSKQDRIQGNRVGDGRCDSVASANPALELGTPG
jgi:hypothetical protein